MEDCSATVGKNWILFSISVLVCNFKTYKKWKLILNKENEILHNILKGGLKVPVLNEMLLSNETNEKNSRKFYRQFYSYKEYKYP